MRHQFTGLGLPAALMLLAPVLAMIGCVRPVAAQRRYPPNWPAANKGCGPDHPSPDAFNEMDFDYFNGPPRASMGALTKSSDVVILAHLGSSSPARWSKARGGPVVQYMIEVYRVLKAPSAGEVAASGPRIAVSALGGTALDPRGLCVYDNSHAVLGPGDYLVFAQNSKDPQGLFGSAWYAFDHQGHLRPASGDSALRVRRGESLATALTDIQGELAAERTQGKQR